MTDRELMILAAKGAGLELWPGAPWRDPGSGRQGLLLANGHSMWNPLASDGDALRLAVKLDMLNENPKFLWHLAGEMTPGTDQYAATRRAIVCAAAEIGKQLASEKS